MRDFHAKRRYAVKTRERERVMSERAHTYILRGHKKRGEGVEVMVDGRRDQ